MKTRCPKCDTCYEIDPDALLKANCLAHCYRCGALFAVVDRHAAEIETADIELMISALRLDQRSEVSAPHPAPDDAPRGIEIPTTRPEPAAAGPAGIDRPDAAATAAVRAHAPRPASPAPAAGGRPDRLPFEVPDDLEPLEPSEDAALGVEDTLYEKPSHRGAVYGLLAVLLFTALGLQLAWQYRVTLLERYPQLAPLCEHIECRPKSAHLPGMFRVLQRDMKPTDNVSDSLTLSASIRNDARIAQPLPDIQLSLLDTNGSVLIRRRLAPADYLFPAPAADTVIDPGEVITISLDFKDPGYLATGFMIDFL